MRQTVFDTIKGLLVERFAIDASLITKEADLHEALGLDSLDAVDLLLAVNETFHARVRTEALDDIHTVGDLVAIIQKHAR